MSEFLIVFAIAVLVVVMWFAMKFFRNDEEPATKALDRKLKPDEMPQDSTQMVLLEQLQRGPGKKD